MKTSTSTPPRVAAGILPAVAGSILLPGPNAVQPDQRKKLA